MDGDDISAADDDCYQETIQLQIDLINMDEFNANRGSVIDNTILHFREMYDFINNTTAECRICRQLIVSPTTESEETYFTLHLRNVHLCSNEEVLRQDLLNRWNVRNFYILNKCKLCLKRVGGATFSFFDLRNHLLSAHKKGERGKIHTYIDPQLYCGQ